MSKKGVGIMNKESGVKILFILFIFVLLTTSILSAQSQKIRVVVKNSSIRLEPDVQGEIIDSPPLGAVFEVIEKIGVWYKVKLNSELYGREEGYINKMFIEELQEKEKPKPEAKQKKELQKKESKPEKKTEKTKEQEEIPGSEIKTEEKEEKPEVGVSGRKTDENKIKTVVNEYINALKNNNLLMFYEQKCTSEFYSEVREDAEWISKNYDRINSCVSDISIQLINNQEAEVRISLIITSLPRMGGSRKLLFEGIYVWNMIKQNNEWKITGASSQPF
jgi:hypothetical protein